MSQSMGAIEEVSGEGVRIGIVVSRFNLEITSHLLEGARKKLIEKKVHPDEITVHWVPGAFEIPLMLNVMADSGDHDGLIALGAVIRGETPHFDYVCEMASRGIMDAMLRFSMPVGFGLLTTDNKEQAMDRIGGKHGHKGEETALVVLEMIQKIQNL